jgi:hypothetical protein
MAGDISEGNPVPTVYQVQDVDFELVVSQNKAIHFGRWPLPSIIASDARLKVV